MSPLRMLAPPAHTRVLLTWELTSDTDLRVVRDGILRYLVSVSPGPEDPSAGPAVAEAICLVMTELAGNALRHGSPPVVVRLLSDEACYLLDVSDHDVDGVPRQPEPHPDFRAGGRGLRIALSMAEQVCWHVDGDAKHVWATFRRHDVVPPC
ncbi:hypothetical protein GCM10010172_85710 [Paractinoplanes ferrugineus]|uniref:Histidine kinase/HSP90-like ATPase domain-containing protein n=1 Tax=Paractinoplanes ferrugineus TaxID=113564 RepID=A0A919JBD4_9ACTN|nr:ATP-binding protein [Actinoplanes ferrugineus]GIE16717.1 hypothetical protein Afe05nite_85570 [Actinoplanes ferrugineus]